MMGSFTLLTYNVANGRAQPARLAEMLRSSGADIVALQELSQAQAEEIERSLGDRFPQRALYPGGFAGKAILSRFPIRSVEQLHLSAERPDLLAHLQLDDLTLTIITAHPPPPRPSPIKLRFNEDTRAQLKSLAGITQKHAPAILVGDFNMTDANPEYAAIAASGLQDAFRAAGRGRGHTLPRRIGPWKRNRWLNGLIRWVPMPPMVRIDFIWHTAGLQSLDAWVGPDAGSDHLPVMAVMCFAGTAA
jgi:endonuclease/exonuclease/phosphatase family metal-dependent hydrolase